MLTDHDKWEEPAAIDGYSDHTMINIAMCISSNSLYRQNALEMLSKGLKIQNFPGELAYSAMCA